MLHSRAGLVAPLVGLLVAATVGPARAQTRPPRPEAFYILNRRSSPPVDASRLPPQVREPYRRVRSIEATFRAAAETLPRGEIRVRRLDRLSARADRAWSRLRVALVANADALDGVGWRLYGDALHQRAATDFVRAYEAGDDDPDAMDRLPEHPDLDPAVIAYRHAAAVGDDPVDTSWARYLEAASLVDMDRRREAEDALRTVATPAAPAALAAEARLRLGELAFDDAELREAAGWYARSLDGLPDPLVPVALYKLAWSRWLDGRPEAAREAIDALPRDAPPEMREELLQLMTRTP